MPCPIIPWLRHLVLLMRFPLQKLGGEHINRDDWWMGKRRRSLQEGGIVERLGPNKKVTGIIIDPVHGTEEEKKTNRGPLTPAEPELQKNPPSSLVVMIPSSVQRPLSTRPMMLTVSQREAVVSSQRAEAVSWSSRRARLLMTFNGMPLQPVPKGQGPLGGAQRAPLLGIDESSGASLGSLSFHRIIQNASRRLIVGAAAESSASSLGLDLFRSIGKNAL